MKSIPGDPGSPGIPSLRNQIRRTALLSTEALRCPGYPGHVVPGYPGTRVKCTRSPFAPSATYPGYRYPVPPGTLAALAVSNGQPPMCPGTR
eukprot:3008187-Rhodomonas_salina.1